MWFPGRKSGKDFQGKRITAAVHTLRADNVHLLDANQKIIPSWTLKLEDTRAQYVRLTFPTQKGTTGGKDRASEEWLGRRVVTSDSAKWPGVCPVLGAIAMKVARHMFEKEILNVNRRLEPWATALPHQPYYLASSKVTNMVKAAIRKARLELPVGTEINGKSFRAGMATALVEAGVEFRLIMQVGRWRSEGMVTRYGRKADVSNLTHRMTGPHRHLNPTPPTEVTPQLTSERGVQEDPNNNLQDLQGSGSKDVTFEEAVPNETTLEEEETHEQGNESSEKGDEEPWYEKLDIGDSLEAYCVKDKLWYEASVRMWGSRQRRAVFRGWAPRWGFNINARNAHRLRPYNVPKTTPSLGEIPGFSESEF